MPKNGPDRFREALAAVYAEAPGRVLPNPLWKTLVELNTGTFSCLVEAANHVVTRLSAYSREVLALYWTLDRSEPLPPALIKGVNLALLHADFASTGVRSAFPCQEGYFRLIRRGPLDVNVQLPSGFRLWPAEPEREAPQVADFIARCYRDLRPTAQAVRRWTHHPTFAPDLWLWIIDEIHDRPAALGIAEFDVRHREAALEWVQVLPIYHRRGLGTALVQALLQRLASRALFTTVSGRIDNPSHPEALYRRCGFQGDDVWWILRR